MIQKRLQRLLSTALCVITLALAQTIRTPAAAAISDETLESISVFQYHYNPIDKYVYTEKPAFFWLFGYNKLYDKYAFLANAYINTIRNQFLYKGRDWMIQIWKGAYGLCLSVGGEIGVYSKPENTSTDHYFSAAEKDWVDMELQIYFRDQFLFKRPYSAYWWCTGFYPKLTAEFTRKIHNRVAMLAKLHFKNETMAKLFCESLLGKNFQELEEAPTHETGDSFFRENTTVFFCWRDAVD